MPGTPRRNSQNYNQFLKAFRAWMPKRKNYASQNAYRAELVRRFLRHPSNNSNNQEFQEAFLMTLPMGNRVWLYTVRNGNANTMRVARIVRPWLNPRETNLLRWGKPRNGNHQRANENVANALQAARNFPRLVNTAKKIQNPTFMTKMYLQKLANTKRSNELRKTAGLPNELENRWYNVSPANKRKIIANAAKARNELRGMFGRMAAASNFNANVQTFQNTVRGNAGNAAKKLLEIRQKAAKRTIGRAVKAGHVGIHIRHLRNLRKRYGTKSPPKRKRASSAPPVLSRR